MVSENISNLIGNFMHYYAIALSFIFGAFIEEWISGRILVKEPKGTKLFSSSNNYLKKKVSILVRIIEVLGIALISIPLSFLLLFLLEQSKYYIFIITIIVANTIYFGTIIELPYKVKLWEGLTITIIYVVSFGLILLLWILTH